MSSPSRRRKAPGHSPIHLPPSYASSAPLSDGDSINSSPEKAKRRRDNFLYHQRHCIPLGLLFMTCFVFLSVSVYNTHVVGTTPGLYVPHANVHHFTPAPVHTRRTACVDQAQTTVVRAFEERGWTVLPLNRKSDVPAEHYTACYKSGNAAIIWTKLIPHAWNTSQPWQRHNQLPFETQMSKKAQTIELLRAYATQQQRTLSFLPETYVLPQDWNLLLKRLTAGAVPDAAQSLRGGAVATTTTTSNNNEPWVVKLSAIDNGIGLAMLGPGSEEFKLLTELLIQGSRRAQVDSYMTDIRRQLVFTQKDDTRKQADIVKAQNRTERTHDKILVQRYICHEMNYQGRKFDLRVYFLIASVDPLVVYAHHDGYLRVSAHAYNEARFDSTGQHLTNLGRNAVNAENNTVSYEQWQEELRKWVVEQQDALSYSWSIRRNPLQHVRNQIKSALADLVAATRHHAFRGYRTYTHMENGFALFGADFIVDRDLNVWFTEGQDSPGLLHETTMKRKLNDRLLPATVDIIGEVLDKQSKGQPLFPMRNTGDFELIYTDDYQYRYDFERKPLLGPCDAAK